MSTAQYGMVIDLRSCTGCQTCVVSCKTSNEVPEDGWWSHVTDYYGGEVYVASTDGGKVSMRFRPTLCNHCENPACVKVCPVGATYKDPETGVVRQDYDKCIGCRMCMSACPYNGVRSFNWEEPAYHLDFPVGDQDVAPHQKHVVEKCTFCWHRLAKGLAPACVEVCSARARIFGDASDPDSEVSRKLRERPAMRLLEDRETEPSVYFLQ